MDLYDVSVWQITIVCFQAIEKNALLENEVEDKAGLQDMVQRLKDESRGNNRFVSPLATCWKTERRVLNMEIALEMEDYNRISMERANLFMMYWRHFVKMRGIAARRFWRAH